MQNFLIEYGLFAAKSLTVLLLISLFVGLLFMLFSSRQSAGESIDITKLNDKFDSMQEALEAEIFPKELVKQRQKQKKRKEKQEAKAEAARYKSLALEEGPIETEKPRVFFIRFEGDLHASETDNLASCITAILSVALPRDEVVILIDSPGGLVHHYGLAASQLDRIKQRGIPLTVCVDLVAASGGYLMASVANRIIAAPFSVIGSIGVFAQIPNFHRLLKKHDVDIEQHTAGEYKTTLTMWGENTEKAREKFQLELEETHELFKSFVREHRPIVDINLLATGEHWYGKQALQLGLVDTLSTSDDYLLSKNKSHDIYEVAYLIEESISSKLSNFLSDFCVKMQRRFGNELRSKAPLV